VKPFSPSLVLLALLLLTARPAHGSDQRLKIEGVWVDDVFHVERIKERDSSKNVRQIRVAGTVWSVSPADRSLRIGPVRLAWLYSQDEEFSTIKTGDVLQVDALQTGPRTFVVLRFERTDLEKQESIEMIGALTGFEQTGDWTNLWLAGISARAPRQLFRNGRMRLRRLDDRRPANQWVFRLGSIETTVGGELEVKSDGEFERDLDKNAEDRQVELQQEAQLEVFFDINDAVSAFAELKLERSDEYAIPWQKTGSEAALKRGELWVYVNEPLGLPVGLQIGRQNFAENREWWWDEDLDALRLDARFNDFLFEVAVAEELGREDLNAAHADAEDQDIFRILARGSLRLSSELAVDLFFVSQRDHSTDFDVGQVVAAHLEDEDDANLTWVGTRLSGNFDLASILETEYWLDVAVLEGDELHYEFDDAGNGEIVVASLAKRKRSGWAYDAGASLKLANGRLGFFSEPALTLGYAMGSGGDSSDGTFIQTGLNDNNSKFNGIDRFRYYGELTRPELSNLRVMTLALGFRLGDDSSVELVHHNYRQIQLSDSHSLRIDADANGRSATLGNEFDLVLGIEEWEHWEFEAVFSHFLPGAAFDNRHAASGFSIKLDYNF